MEFYDTSQDAARFPGGQFVSRYYMTDLLEDNSIAVSLDTMLKNGNQFSLDGGIPAWTVEGDDLAKVNDFLKKSCMEFSGSLPGDEKDEDGYSLTGEAKDATASRDGLKKNPYSACPHDFTTGRWRMHLVYPGESRADGIPRGSKKGNPPCADTMVEFYDTEDNGQFVASFHMNTLLGYPWNGMAGADLDGLEAYGFAYPLSTQAATDWLECDDLAKVNAFLKETCKEVFGILPGADDGGYSLSGETKEAALSRFALPENRKAALNVIRKLNESRDSNENAL